MSFLTVVLRGLYRRPVRTSLTLVGIAIGIAAVVALVGVSRGFDKSWDNGLKVRHIDIVVNSLGKSLTPKPFAAALQKKVAEVPGVTDTCALLVDLVSVENVELMLVSARQWGGFSWDNLKLVSGRMPKDASEPAVVLGTTAAELLKKKPGDTLELETREVNVVGIVDGGAYVENGSVILSLPLFQDITGNQGKISVIDVRTKPGLSKPELESICTQINKIVPEARAGMANENINSSQVYRMARGMSWATSLLAVLVGVLGVMNTMLMTVFERKQEIAVLLAIGWRRGRVLAMILFESAALGFFGGLVGVVLGVIGTQFLGEAPALKGLLRPDVSIGLLVTSTVIAVFVGVVSGLYPAWRSSRINPGLALQG